MIFTKEEIKNLKRICDSMIKDKQVVDKTELDFIKNAPKIYKRNANDKVFVVKTISATAAEGYASADGGKTWETAKTRIVRRNNSLDTRHQEERRFSSDSHKIEIPFSHIVYCYHNNLSVIPNETIDHVNGNHLDDNINNLEPVSNAKNIQRMKENLKSKNK